MKLTKEEWQRYKKRNINRIQVMYLNNLDLVGSRFWKFINKHPKMYAFWLRLLKTKWKMDFRLYRKASYANLDFQITTRCTLNCEQCCSLMPFFNKKTHYDETFETFKMNLDNLLKNVTHF